MVKLHLTLTQAIKLLQPQKKNQIKPAEEITKGQQYNFYLMSMPYFDTHNQSTHSLFTNSHFCMSDPGVEFLIYRRKKCFIQIGIRLIVFCNCCKGRKVE